MLYTKEQVRDNIRNLDGKRVFYLGKQDILTAEAKDWLNAQRIQILPAQQARRNRYQLITGGELPEKPEHMTHLNGDVLVPKTHPRIGFRGAVDSLEAELLWCGKQYPHLQKQLGEILSLTRKLISCDVLGEPVGETVLCGLSEQEQRKRSHFPQEHYGIPHFMPAFSDQESVLGLNRVRTVARHTELMAVDAFSDREGNPTRVDILQALNRISSMLYIMMIQEKSNDQRQ